MELVRLLNWQRRLLLNVGPVPNSIDLHGKRRQPAEEFDLHMYRATCMHTHVQTHTINKLRCNLKLDLKCDDYIYNKTLLEDFLWNSWKSSRDCQPEIMEKCFFCFNGKYTLIPKNNSIYCGSKTTTGFTKLLLKTNY